MLFPKHEAIVNVVKTLDEAVNWCTDRSKFGGCFEQKNDEFICYCLPKDHEFVEEFSW